MFALVVDDVRVKRTVAGYPRREGDRYLRLFLMFGEDCDYIYSDTAISDEQLEALEGIKDIILNGIGE